MKYITTIGGREFTVEIIDEHHVSVDGVVYQVDFESVSGQPVYSLLADGESFEGVVYNDEGTWFVLRRGVLYTAEVEDEREKRLRAASGGNVAAGGVFHLKAPMPGLVVSIPVSEGQQVQTGDVLLILESMKMQNELKSPKDGVISRLRVTPGESVEQKQTLLSVE